MRSIQLLRVFYTISRLILIAFIYFVTARIGLLFVFQPENVAAVWPVSGFGLGILLITKKRDWPGIIISILIGNSFANIVFGHSPVTSFGFAISNCAESLLAAWLLIFFMGESIRFDKIKQVIAFLFLSIILSNALTALMGTYVSSMSYGVPFWSTWRVWWIADGIGMLLVTPVIVLWTTQWRDVFSSIKFYRVGELIIALGALIALTAYLLGFMNNVNSHSELYLIFPLFIWIALRFQTIGVVTTSLIFSFFFIFQSPMYQDLSPDLFEQFAGRVLAIQVFLGVTIFTIFILAVEVTERINTEKKLQEREETARVLLNAPADTIILLDTEGIIHDVNEAVINQLAQSRNKLIGSSIWVLYPHDITTGRKNYIEELIRSKSPVRFEDKYKEKWYDNVLYPIFGEQKNVYRIALFTRDITQSKFSEDQIKKDLKEKEVMLREINHRVKNNMQVIISLLNLQSEKLSDNNIKTLFNQSKNRIYSMALIHEQLYMSKDLSMIDMKSYVETLLRNIYYLYVPNNKFNYQIEIQNVSLDINKAIPCGLLLNELISNSFKHAFSKTDAGCMTIAISMIDENNCELIVQDNGKGLPDNFNIQKVDSLGLKLVTMLASQLNGSLHLENTNGTKATIRFMV